MSQNVKALLVCVGVVAGLGGIAAVGAHQLLGAGSDETRVEYKPDNTVQRGAYLWSTLGCIDCHTPKDQKGEPLPGMQMAGHPEGSPLPEWDPSMLQKNILMTANPTGTAFAGPWGTAIAPNLTPDTETGIGTMTAAQFMSSFRTGKHWKTGQDIMPPMPWPVYRNLTDSDFRALHSFLMTLPPVKNKVPESKPAGKA